MAHGIRQATEGEGVIDLQRRRESLLGRQLERATAHGALCPIDGEMDEQIRLIIASKIVLVEGQLTPIKPQVYLARLQAAEKISKDKSVGEILVEELSQKEKALLEKINQAAIRGPLIGMAIGAGIGGGLGAAGGALVGLLGGIPLGGGGAILTTPAGAGIGFLAGLILGGALGASAGVAFSRLHKIIKLVEKSDNFKSWQEKVVEAHLFQHLILFAKNTAQNEGLFPRNYCCSRNSHKILDCALKNSRGSIYHLDTVKEIWSRRRRTHQVDFLESHTPDFATSAAIHQVFLNWVQSQIDLIDQHPVADAEVAEYRRNLVTCKQYIYESALFALDDLENFSVTVLAHLETCLDHCNYNLDQPYSSRTHGEVLESVERARFQLRCTKIEVRVRKAILDFEMDKIEVGEFCTRVARHLEPYDIDGDFRDRMLTLKKTSIEKKEMVSLPLFDEGEEPSNVEENSEEEPSESLESL